MRRGGGPRQGPTFAPKSAAFALARPRANPRMAVVLVFERPVVELVARVRELRELASEDPRFSAELRRLEDKAAVLAREVFAGLTPMQKVQLSRHPSRP